MGINDFALVEPLGHFLGHQIKSSFLKVDLDKVKNTHNLLTYIRNLLTSPLRMGKAEFMKVKPKWASMFLH